MQERLRVCVCLCVLVRVCLHDHWKRRSLEVKVTECLKSLCPGVDKTLAEAGYTVGSQTFSEV